MSLTSKTSQPSRGIILAAYHRNSAGESSFESGFLFLDSANFIRRNLGDFNLETDTAIRGRSSDQVFGNAGDYFSLLWNNSDQWKFSVNYDQYKDHSKIRVFLYRWMESVGMSTF